MAKTTRQTGKQITANKSQLAANIGPVNGNEAYALETFKKLVGMTKSGMRSARRHGLKVKRFGRRSYVLGKDWIEFLDDLPSVTGVP